MHQRENVEELNYEVHLANPYCARQKADTGTATNCSFYVLKGHSAIIMSFFTEHCFVFLTLYHTDVST